MIEIKAPDESPDNDKNKKVFLAGTISESKIDWQKNIVENISGNITFYNPKRLIWDKTWEQKISNPQFKQQVVWELKHLEKADIVIMYLEEDTISPISLLEFGLYARSGKMVVYCPEGFWRKGNVDVVCEMYNIPQVEKFEELITLIKYTH